MKPPTKAVRRALAYCAAVGDLPTHLHMQTWLSARKYLVDSDYQTTRRFHNVSIEGLAVIANEPLYMAHRYLVARGFTVRRSHRRGPSHYIPYHALDMSEALAHRQGGVSIRPHREKPPYTTETVSSEAVAQYLKGLTA